jgi:hypothetical protein
METISLWRNSTKFKYLFFHLEIYLIKQIDMEMFINDFEYVVDAWFEFDMCLYVDRQPF